MDIRANIPVWLKNSPLPHQLNTYEDFMKVAINLSRENVERGTGGPFGAAVFDTVTGMAVSLGVNLVESQACSILHAEVVAIIQAQQALQCYNLNQKGRYLLASSSEPCAMCIGAIPWSGISELVYGAHCRDVEAIGFDEGYKPTGWQQALNSRGITVFESVLREDARDVLQLYQQNGSVVYNGMVQRQRGL